MQIIIDSNIYCADYHMTSSDFKVLFAGLSASDHRLFVPRVVLDEVVGNFRRELVTVRGRLAKVQSGYRRLTGGDLSASISDSDVERMTEEFRAEMGARLAAFPTTLLSYPEVSHEALVKRAINRERPFSEAGSGYRDALIWDSVVQVARGGHIVAFITADRKAFAGSGNELHPDLSADLAVQGIDSQRVLFYDSLKQFVDDHITPTLDAVTDDIRRQIEAGEFAGIDLLDEIGIRIVESTGGTEFEAFDLDLPSEAESPSIVAVHDVSNLRSADIRRLDSSELFVEIELDAEVESYFSIYGADFWAMSERELASVFVSDRDAGDKYISASAVTSVHVGLSMTLDAGLGEIMSFEVQYVEPLEHLGDDQ